MNKLIMDKKFLRIKDSYRIKTTDNQHLYLAEAKTIKKIWDYIVTDQENKEVAKIVVTWKKRLIHADLIINEEKICSIQRLKKKNGINKFIIEALDMQIISRKSNFVFDVYVRDQKIAKIERVWLRLVNTYELHYLLDHLDERMQLILIFIAIVIDKANLTIFSNVLDSI